VAWFFTACLHPDDCSIQKRQNEIFILIATPLHATLQLTSKCFANIIAHPLSDAPPPQHHPSVFAAMLIALSTFAATVSTSRSYLDRLSFTQTLLTMNCQPPTKRYRLSNQVSNQEMKAAELLAPRVLVNNWSSKEAQSTYF